MKKCGCQKDIPEHMYEECMMQDECEMPMPGEHMEHMEHMEHTEHMGHMGHMKDMMHMMHMHGGHMMPGMNKMMLAMMSLVYFRMHSDPITEYACMQVKKDGVKCAISEAALLGLLIGMGYSHEKAHMVLDNWKKCR